MPQFDAAISFASFLWLPLSLLVTGALGVVTWIGARQRSAGSSPEPALGAALFDSVGRLGSLALWLAIALTLGGAATVFASGPLADAELNVVPAVAIVVLDLMTVALVAAFVRIALLVRRGRMQGAGRAVAVAYAVTIIGVVVVLACIAVIGLPHLGGGIIG